MPRLGSNGGLMGPRRVSTTSNASGSWLLDEQCDAQRAGIWPTAPDAPASIPLQDIVYSKNEVWWSGFDPAYETPLGNLVFRDGVATSGGAVANDGYIKMDLGQAYMVEKIVIGSWHNGFTPPWAITNNCDILHSVNGTTWTTSFNLIGEFTDVSIKEFDINVEARYIAIKRISSGDYAGVSEFYALAPGQTYIPNPIPALSPVLWYDFADESTVTTSGTAITSVTDKGSRGWTLAKTTEPASPAGPQYVSGINGLQCVDWGNSAHSNRLRNTDTTSTNVAEMYFVLDAAFDSTFPDYNGLAGGTADPVNLTGNAGSTGFYAPGTTTPWNRAFLNGSTTNAYYYSVLPTINSASLLRINRSDDAAVELTSGFQIGMDRNNSWRGWFGLIGEVVCFSSVLSPTDRDAVQAWLATKWGITLEGQGNG